MTNDLFMDKCTRHFRNCLVQAFSHAAIQGTKVVTPLHLLYALVCETGCIGEEILRRSGLRREILAQMIDEGELVTEHSTIILSPNTKRAIEHGVMRAARDGHAYIGTEHLLHGLTQIDSADVELILKTSGVKRKDLDQQLDVALKSAGKLPEMLSNIWGPQKQQHMGKVANLEKGSKQKNPALEYFGVELTDPKFAQRIDPVIGRESEIERVIHILARRTKNNPLLLGDPGVGKTAIVEGLAKRIVAGEVPPTLLGKRIFAIDLGLMVAGTMYRGEFESRVKQLVEEVKANPELILFIDEIHSIVGAGSSSGTLDAANLLKPALARGELHVIGATTFEEFKKNIEHDAALERRFQPVQVREPSAEETLTILSSIKTQYEKFHGITITDEAVETAVKLSGKYFPEKRYPDKAIDLLDEAMSAVKVQTANVDRAVHQNGLKRELLTLEQNKQRAILKEDYEEAQKIKLHEMDIVNELAALGAADELAPPRANVQVPDVTAVVSRILSRTISEQQSGTTPTRSLGEFLRTKIFGQDDIIDTIATTVTRAQLGLHGDHRPLASFLFVGSSGVGKTELAKLIAEGVYNDPKALIRLDMTEFSEGFSVSKMLGAPAGYVGFRESITMVDRLRRQPLSVLLFDEIDKAHPDVLNILLQMLEEGRLTDASGKEASVKQTIIILTYQVPLEEVRGSQFGFVTDTPTARDPEQVRKSLYSVMRPELLNRIDHVCVFKPMEVTQLGSIAEQQLHELAQRLGRRSISLKWADRVPFIVATKADEPREGARRVRHIIEEQIEKPLIADFAAHPDRTGYHITAENDILGIEPYGTGHQFTIESAQYTTGSGVSKPTRRTKATPR